MGKILVITEKTKQVRALKKGLRMNFTTKTYRGKYPKKDEPNLFYESDDVIIVALRGHLFTLYDVQDYLGLSTPDGKKVSWRTFADKIPYVPDRFVLKLAGTFESDQFDLVKQLINRDDVDKVYNFADPDAEGELLMREVLTQARCKKPVYRVETESLVPGVVAEAFYNPYNPNNYNSLYFEALARQQTDWLTGINYSTMFTLKTGINYNVGRVLYAIVLYVYNARKAIEDFKPTTSYGIKLTVKRDGKKIVIYGSSPEISFAKDEKEKCKQLCDALNSGNTVVTKVEKKKKNLSPKRLYNTAKYYSDMSNMYGISMDDAAKAAQYLYEEGRIMYPRTESEYLQTAEIPNTKRTIEKLEANGYPVKFHTKKSVFDDSKSGRKGEGGHTAIVVTENFYTLDELRALPKVTQAAYLLIFNRTVANFCEAPDIDETKVTLTNGDYTFTMNGCVVNSKGFLQFDPRILPDELPLFAEGEVLDDAKFEVAEKKTKAPPAPTTSNLINYLKNPFRDITIDDVLDENGESNDSENFENEKKGVQIGTGGTMAPTTTKAIKYGYITEKKGVYDITPKGRSLVEMFQRLNFHNLDPVRTLDLNKKIKAIGKRTYTLEQNKEEIRKELNQTSYNLKNANIVINLEEQKDKIGNCPKCGSPVVEGEKSFYCSNKACKFYLFKADNFFKKAFNKEINKTMAKGFLSAKRTAKVTGLKSKDKVDEKGKPKKYDLNVRADFSGDYPQYEILGFATKSNRKEVKKRE